MGRIQTTIMVPRRRSPHTKKPRQPYGSRAFAIVGLGYIRRYRPIIAVTEPYRPSSDCHDANTPMRQYDPSALPSTPRPRSHVPQEADQEKGGPQAADLLLIPVLPVEPMAGIDHSVTTTPFSSRLITVRPPIGISRTVIRAVGVRIELCTATRISYDLLGRGRNCGERTDEQRCCSQNSDIHLILLNELRTNRLRPTMFLRSQ